MIGMVLTIGLLGLGLVLCLRSASALQHARDRLDRLETASLDQRTSDLTSAADELARAVDLQG